MSLVVGLHLGNLAIIAADKRVVSMYGQTMIVDHDEAEKIINAGIGYVSGSGIVELLDLVKEALADIEITHTDQIRAIISRERDRFRSVHSANPEWAEQQIKKTGWMFTYMTEAGGETVLRVALVHGAWNDDEIGLLYKGTAKVLVPVDGTAEEAQRLSDMLTQNLKTTDELPNLVASISYHVPLLRVVFKYASEICETASETFHVAVHGSDSQMLISKEILASTVSVQFEG